MFTCKKSKGAPVNELGMRLKFAYNMLHYTKVIVLSTSTIFDNEWSFCVQQCPGVFRHQRKVFPQYMLQCSKKLISGIKSLGPVSYLLLCLGLGYVDLVFICTIWMHFCITNKTTGILNKIETVKITVSVTCKLMFIFYTTVRTS